MAFDFASMLQEGGVFGNQKKLEKVSTHGRLAVSYFSQQQISVLEQWYPYTWMATTADNNEIVDVVAKMATRALKWFTYGSDPARSHDVAFSELQKIAESKKLEASDIEYIMTKFDFNFQNRAEMFVFVEEGPRMLNALIKARRCASQALNVLHHERHINIEGLIVKGKGQSKEKTEEKKSEPKKGSKN